MLTDMQGPYQSTESNSDSSLHALGDPDVPLFLHTCTFAP